MGELLVILAIALIFLGPKRLPDLATTLGKAIRSFRKATSDLSDQLEVDESIKQPLRELRSALRDEPQSHQLATMQAPPSTNAIDPKADANANAQPPKSDAPSISEPAKKG